MEFSDNFKKARLAEGMTQQQVADILKLDRSIIAYYEIGIKEPDSEMIPLISETLNVSTEYLLEILTIKMNNRTLIHE